MIGEELMGINCPKCNVPTMGSSAKASVIREMLGYTPPGADMLEVIFYAVCPQCMAVILPGIFNPHYGENKRR